MLLLKRMVVIITRNSTTTFLPGGLIYHVFGENHIFEMQRLVFWQLCWVYCQWTEVPWNFYGQSYRIINLLKYTN